MKIDKLEKAVKRFDMWLNHLNDHDRMNFTTLVNLPNADEICEKLPEGEYRDMAIFARAVMQLNPSTSHE